LIGFQCNIGSWPLVIKDVLQDIRSFRQCVSLNAGLCSETGKWRSLPDSVSVPVLMDNDLGRAEGQGSNLVVVPQNVLAQVHSVGATSARRPGHNTTETLWSDVAQDHW